jgi:S-DNA-T family DNA segregation ATPase FtsK/SpoIIIE
VSQLTASTLIGRVATLYLKHQLTDTWAADDEACVRIDRLKPEQTAAITKAILADPELSIQVDIKLPRHFFEHFGLPEEVLTDQRATYHRNAERTKALLLIASAGDDEEQSLQLITPLGEAQLVGRPDLWVSVASEGLSLPEGEANHWEKAFVGLRDINGNSLLRIAEYVVQTRNYMAEEGESLIHALGFALPALQIPRDTPYFVALAENKRARASAWKPFYEKTQRQNAPYLRKQTPSQSLLSTGELLKTFGKMSESDTLSDETKSIIEDFIGASNGWTPEADALAKCEWGIIKPLFTGLKLKKGNLGADTQSFFEELEADTLTKDEQQYLVRLRSRRLSLEAGEEDINFYEAHRNQLRDERNLKSAWDRFIYGAPKETDDFLAGLALCLERLFIGDEESTNRQLRIRLDGSSQRGLKKLNVDAGSYFAFRYKGLSEIFCSNVIWDVGDLFDYPILLKKWRSKGKYVDNTSVAKAALQLKFAIKLDVELPNGTPYSASTQLIWKYNPTNVTSELASDWGRLNKKPLPFCSAERETVSAKGVYQSVDLHNVRTFVPSYDKDRGSFVGLYKSGNDISKAWPISLKTAVEKEYITKSVEALLTEKWKAFQIAYTNAVQGFWKSGLAFDGLETQVHAYADLMTALYTHAKGSRNRDLLLRPLLRVGSVTINGGSPAEVIAPWHPLRMTAMAIKARRVAQLFRYFLQAPKIQFGDSGRLFFKDLQEELEHPFYPEIGLGWRENKPELLALSDTCADYTLHEPPRIGENGQEETSDNPTEGSKRVVDLVDRYLKLQPHESANLSVVLYNCDSARLPQAVVDRIGALHEDDEDVRCQVVLRHRNTGKLRQLYERIIESSDVDPDAYSASEATRDFMARLRIGISADQASAPTPKDGPPNDIVFSQDVIARHARIKWYKESARPMELMELVPANWSRRRPAAHDDMKSVVYLCCPVQSEPGWAYLTAVTSFFNDDWDGDINQRLLPARQLDFQEPEMQKIFEETHNLGNWVVNYDELLDRRQLLNQDVRVIRYKQSNTQGRNLIVSSDAPLNLLQSMVRSRIANLKLGLSDADEKKLALKFIDDANGISGDIVLRAAKRGRSASELMGVVLSRFLIQHEIEHVLGADARFGWYFLDDYADWLGQPEQQLADILMLSPSKDAQGNLRLAIIISEAKYIDFSGLAGGSKNSRKQLSDTLNRVNEAVFGAPERIDRSLWLSRLADLILDGVKFPASASINLADWRRAVREGECDIWLRGYSQVFISGPTDSVDGADFTPIAGIEDGYQEVFSYPQVRELVLQYFRGEDPTPLRCVNADGPNLGSPAVFTRPPSLDGKEAKPVISSVSTPLIESMSGSTETNISLDSTVKTTASTEVKVTANEITGMPVTTPGDSTLSPASPWAYPGISDIVARGQRSISESKEDAEWLKQTEHQTKLALQGFGFQAKLLESKLTPNAALLKFQGSANLTIDQVLRKQTEFKTTYGLSLVSVQPEPGKVALAVERPQRQVVRLEDLWGRWNPSAANGNQNLVIATREDNGELLILSPERNAPHTLIAGSTGSGKSVLMQNIILSIAATNTPAQAQILLIDPKLGVDYFAFDDLPHIKGGVIDNQERALEALEELVAEMNDRYSKFKAAKTAKLSAYNQKVELEHRLPVIWLIHDEFAEWMLIEEYKQQVTSIVGRLGVKARAAGIYLVFAAQRPDANVMPMQLRANLGNRLILKVDSEGTSEIALGVKGAERLLGRGHLLAKLEGEASMLFGQVPLIEDDVIEDIVKVIAAG